jgi:hypothetical protein
MQHQRAQHDVELPIRKRQPFDDPLGEGHVHSRFARFAPCPGDHFRRGIDAVHACLGAGVPLRRNRQRAGAAADIQYRLTWSQARETHQPFPERSLPAQQVKPGQEVVAGRRMQDSAFSARGVVAILGISHVTLRTAD